MAKRIGKSLYRLQPSETLFMLCDVQEKFRPAIPLLEQYPEKLGNTVCELDVGHACCVLPKTKFSMFLPAAQEMMKKSFGEKPKTAVLFGVETHKDHKSFKQIAPLVKQVSADLMLWQPTAPAKAME